MLATGWFYEITMHLIDSNSTKVITENAMRAAQAAAPKVEFIGRTSQIGPSLIEGLEDDAASIPPLLILVRKASDAGADAIRVNYLKILACSRQITFTMLRDRHWTS